MIVRQKDIEILMQSDKVLYYKLELLDKNMKVLDSLEGDLISDNISIDSSSSIRRTYNCTLFVKDDTLLLKRDSKIFFDKLIRPYIGILHQRSNTVQWYLLGTFLYTELNYQYNATTKELNLTCLDMMSLLDDSRYGQVSDYKRTILANTDAREVIINLLQEVGITKYFIEFNINGHSLGSFKIPYDLVFEAGTTIYTILKELVDLYSGTQMFFSVDGVFTISRIPTNKNEINTLNDDVLQPLLIDEQVTTSLSSVYNHVIVWGKLLSVDYYTQKITSSNGVYYANVVTSKLDETTNESVETEYNSLENFDTFALKIPSTNIEYQMININNLGNKPIVDIEGNNLIANYLEANTDYIFKYREESDDFLYCGQYQCYGEAFLTNDVNSKSEFAVIDKDSDFAIEVIGDRLKIISGSEAENIYTDSLCSMRARFELYNSSNLQDSLSLSIMAIPFLDINQKVIFTSNITNQTHEYIITNITCDYSTFQMNLSLSRFYPDYI